MNTPRRLILDTNVVLDWLAFNDLALQVLSDAVQAGRVLVYSHRLSLDELHRVLSYPALKLHAGRQIEVFAQYQTLASAIAMPNGFSLQNLLTPAGFPMCRDADDQLFVALALHSQADALVSRDRAVLALRKKAAKFGVKIMDVVQLNANLLHPVRDIV